MIPFGLPWPALIAAAVVTVLSAGRITRLIVNDHWPPVEWLRGKWDANSDRLGGWWLLVHCPWCFGPWATLVVLAWGILSHLHWSWWLVNGWLALSYLASMVVFHDEGSDDGDDA